MKGPLSLMSIWEMYPFNAARFFEAAHEIGQQSVTIMFNSARQGGGFHITRDAFKDLKDSVTEVREHCERSGLVSVSTSAGRVLECLDTIEKAGPVITMQGGMPVEILKADHTVAPVLFLQFNELNSRMKDELSATRFFQLSTQESLLYQPRDPHFGSEVRTKFQSAAKDIDEASKCLALGRYTASVFHCMRVMEVALDAVRACLAVPPSGRNWGDALKDIRDERLKRGGTKWSKNDFFQEVYGRLDAVKDAWRNPTMHIDNVYTEEDATRIFDNTKSFMQKIASTIDEKGLPLA